MPELNNTILKNSSSLKAYYRMESGALTTDSSGNGYTLTNNNTVAEGTGKFGGAADLGSSNSTKYLSIANNLGIDSSATFSFWIKLQTEISTGNYTLFENSNATTKVYYQIQYQYNSGTRRLLFRRTKPGVADNTFTFNYTLGTSTYNHLVLSFDGSNVRGYINGTYVGVVASSGNGTDGVSNLFYIGLNSGTNEYTSGLYDDFPVFSTALSPDQIKELYEGRYIGEGWPQANLVGLWHLNGNSTDLSGNNNHGTDTAVTYSLANGKFGQGGSFNGATTNTSKISVGSTNFPSGSNARTFSAWIYKTGDVAYAGMFGYGTEALNTAALFSFNSAGQKLVFGKYGSDASPSDTVVTNNVWHYIVITVSGSTIKYYLDGKADGTQTLSGINTTLGGYAYIGRAYESGGRSFNGYLDEVQIFSVAKDAAWVRKQYAWGVGKHL